MAYALNKLLLIIGAGLAAVAIVAVVYIPLAVFGAVVADEVEAVRAAEESGIENVRIVDTYAYAPWFRGCGSRHLYSYKMVGLVNGQSRTFHVCVTTFGGEDVIF